MLGVHTRVHTAVAILAKECVDSLNTGLRRRGWSDTFTYIKEVKLHSHNCEIFSNATFKSPQILFTRS